MVNYNNWNLLCTLFRNKKGNDGPNNYGEASTINFII